MGDTLNLGGCFGSWSCAWRTSLIVVENDVLLWVAPVIGEYVAIHVFRSEETLRLGIGVLFTDSRSLDDKADVLIMKEVIEAAGGDTTERGKHVAVAQSLGISAGRAEDGIDSFADAWAVELVENWIKFSERSDIVRFCCIFAMSVMT